MKFVGYITTFVLAVAVAVTLSIFSLMTLAAQDESQRGHIDQGQVCVATSDEEALGCPAGGLFMARLPVTGEDIQTPLRLENRLLNTMALYCDTNHEIHRTQTGVICVLTHERISAAASDEDA